ELELGLRSRSYLPPASFVHNRKTHTSFRRCAERSGGALLPPSRGVIRPCGPIGPSHSASRSPLLPLPRARRYRRKLLRRRPRAASPIRGSGESALVPCQCRPTSRTNSLRWAALSGSSPANVSASISPWARHSSTTLPWWCRTHSACPVKWGGLRPYAGIGLALNLVRRATPIGAPDAETIEFIESSRSTISAKITLGAQAQYQNVAIFGEGSVLPTKREFLLNGEEAV